MRRKYRCSFDKLIIASLANTRRGLFKEQYTKNTDNHPDKFEDCIVLEAKFTDAIGFTKIKKKTGVRDLADIILVKVNFSCLLHCIT